MVGLKLDNKRCTRLLQEPPGPIDNTDLQDDEVPECLKQGLVSLETVRR